MLSQPEINDRLKQAEQEAKAIAKSSTAKYIKFSNGFWCGNYSNPDFGTCCFMHWRGLPIGGDGKRHPLYKFQQPIIDDLENGIKYLAIFKAPKLGISEIFLSYAVYKTLTDQSWQNGQVAILVGTNEKDGQFMLERIKKMINGRVPIDSGKYENKSRFTLNTVVFMAMPAGHYDTIRQRPNMRMIMGDEIAFFVKKKDDQQAIRSAFEHYHTSGYTIVGLITTAGEAPAGFAFDIFKEQNSIWKKYTLYGKVGLEVNPQSNTSIYDLAAYEDKRTKSPSTFAREMDLKWGYEAGNVFKFEDIQAATETKYDLDQWRYAPCSMALDPAFGTGEKNSKFAFIVAAMVDKKFRVYAFKLLSAATIDEALTTARNWIDTFKPASI